MKPIATTLVAWAGVYAYVALYYGALRFFRPEQREYQPFAGLCASLAMYSLATAVAISADSVAGAVGALQAQVFAALSAMAFFVDFALRLAEESRPRLLRFMYAWTLGGMAVAATRLFFDPARSDPSYDWGPSAPTSPAVAELSVIGTVVLAVAVGVSSFATFRLFACTPRRRELWLAAGAISILILAGCVDIVASVVDSKLYYLSGHVALLSILGFSYVLLGRFTNVDAQLARRKEELARSHDHLRSAQEELVKKEQLAAVGELSAVIAHEVRNPLAIIKNAVSGLRRKELGPEDAETLLSILDEENDRLNRLVNDLLAYAKPIAPEAAELDLRNVVMNAVELAAGGNRDISQVEVELELEQEVDRIEGDAALLRHALINIVDNALQAMPSGGTLKITCRNTELDGRPSVAVDFRDTGEGMDTLVRSKARDPFFTTRRTGTGLGLAIVDRVARAHGGRVEIDSRHGKGTTVSFIVPRDRSSSVVTA